MPKLTFTSYSDKVEGGTHSYILIWETIDQNGDRVFSSPSSAADITFSDGTSHAITLPGDMLAMTSRTDLTLGVYRNTVTNGVPGTIYYRVNDPLTEIIRNDPTALSWTYVDDKPDDLIETGQPLYTSEGQLPADP